MKGILFFDIETNSKRIDRVIKIHCIVAAYVNNKRLNYKVFYNGKEFIEFSHNFKWLCGHNIYGYDYLVLNKLYGFNPSIYSTLDTLLLSNYAFPKEGKYSLEHFGNVLGVKKLNIEDWVYLDKNAYVKRCARDVRITYLLFIEIVKKLRKLYSKGGDLSKLINHLSFKAYCAYIQMRNKFRLDIENTLDIYEMYHSVYQARNEKLKDVMPPQYTVKKRPQKLYKKDGSLTVYGLRWKQLVEQYAPTSDFANVEEVKIPVEANPDSTEQIKSWLFSLGWEPCTYTIRKTKTGENRVPQIYVDGNEGKELAPSVKKLAKKHSAVTLLEDKNVAKSRLNILKGFLDNVDKDGFIPAGIRGLANTLRFRHAVIVNLPKVTNTKKLSDGYYVRSLLLPHKGYRLCGCDMVSLEDTTKRHFMSVHDKKLVKIMEQDDYDPHLYLARYAGEITQEEYDKYLRGELAGKDFQRIKKIRTLYKKVNYSCLYGIGATGLARDAGISKSKAAKLIDFFWKLNWSVKAYCMELKKQTVKTEKGTENWLLNPISNMWICYKEDKDVFSGLNQSTGAYCFDRFIYYILQHTENVLAQFHDEVVIMFPENKQHEMEIILKASVKHLNDELKLNVKLDIDYTFGENYAEVH